MKSNADQIIETLRDIEKNGELVLNKKGKPALDELGYEYRKATSKQEKRMARLTELDNQNMDALRKKLADMARKILGDEEFNRLNNK
jgi:hypothetical protein